MAWARDTRAARTVKEMGCWNHGWSSRLCRLLARHLGIVGRADGVSIGTACDKHSFRSYLRRRLPQRAAERAEKCCCYGHSGGRHYVEA